MREIGPGHQVAATSPSALEQLRPGPVAGAGTRAAPGRAACAQFPDSRRLAAAARPGGPAWTPRPRSGTTLPSTGPRSTSCWPTGPGTTSITSTFLAWVDDVAPPACPCAIRPPRCAGTSTSTTSGLERAGVPTVPTSWVEPGAAAGWQPGPAGGRSRGQALGLRRRPPDGALRVPRARRRPGPLAELLAAGRTAMVQPYEPRSTPRRDGARLRRRPLQPRPPQGADDPPGRGPQDDLIDNQVVTGRTAPRPADVASRALATAEDLLGPTSYARVDLVGDKWAAGRQLLELELLDPVLFFAHHPRGRRRRRGLGRGAHPPAD